MNANRCVILAALSLCTSAMAQAPILFDFDNAPVYTPFPVNVTAGGITAHLSGTGSSYSIQGVGTAPVVPIGFTGHFIYPSSVFAADLLISFSVTLTDFSIQYSPQELGCDDSATMKVTAYLGAALVGSNTATCPNPGTWPVGTLAFHNASGFDNVVIHYQSRPPTCQDYGVIFIADNMIITPMGSAPCYANCDGSTSTPILTANDFQCFLNKFAAADPTANCDGSTATPILTANDFQCFLNTYAAGCS